MELRTAESKSLIRRRLWKLILGAGSRSQPTAPATQAQLFFSFPLFLSFFTPDFFSKMKDPRPLQVHLRPGFILFSLFCHCSRVKAWTRTAVFLHLVYSLRFNLLKSTAVVWAAPAAQIISCPSYVQCTWKYVNKCPVCKQLKQTNKMKARLKRRLHVWKLSRSRNIECHGLLVQSVMNRHLNIIRANIYFY